MPRIAPDGYKVVSEFWNTEDMYDDYDDDGNLQLQPEVQAMWQQMCSQGLSIEDVPVFFQLIITHYNPIPDGIDVRISSIGLDDYYLHLTMSGLVPLTERELKAQRAQRERGRARTEAKRLKKEQDEVKKLRGLIQKYPTVVEEYIA